MKETWIDLEENSSLSKIPAVKISFCIICIAYAQMLSCSKDPFKYKLDQLPDIDSFELVNKEKRSENLIITKKI
ncbi:hypothetical protein BpHYR1_025279 [Brachionus plicatilis]|uniref:Uncharacterized protein n=1 Tax=Brachionus plicatilis TaxID=10195 RepID=A0A3M7SLD7_BRAPC|nr:hypothetical protein BpHYR1_025279 [Brachionus plicatilis]